MSVLGVLELAVGAAMLFGIAIALIIMSVRWLRPHVPTENRNDGLPQNSDPPLANHVVEIPPQILFLTQGEENEDTAGNAPLEKQSAVIHPYPITQPRPTSTLANRRRLTHVLSLNSYMFEHPSPYVVNSMVEDPLRPAANNAPSVTSLAGQPALLFSPRPPVYRASNLGGSRNRRPPPPLEDIHVKDVFPIPPVPTPMTRHGPGHGVVAWPSSSKSLHHFSGTIFKYQELEKATNGFSQEDNFLGSGAFGSVYRGTLSNGAEIAVKWLRPDSQRMEQEFEAEVDTISHIRYTHLVSMIGCCVYGDVRLLVYEFVPNNTLHFHLHGEGRPTIDWPTRVKIAQGSAKGLTYLHESCVPRIIHRDIKACNILIDFEFNAKVADFGLAKLFPNSFTHLSTQLAGTFGYMDPEYYNSGKLTEKSDVYSFGVMLLELITGRKPRGLALWAKGESPDEEHDYDSLVDPRLQGKFNAEEMARMVACAAACTRRYRRVRPSMSQVVRILKGEGSLDELNHGINQFWDNSIGQFDGDLKKFWKNAFVSPNNSPTNGWGMSLNSPN